MAVVKLNNDIRELELKEQKEIEVILASLSQQVAAELESIHADQMCIRDRYLRDPSGIYGKVSWSGLRIPWYHGESHVPVHWLLLRCVLFVRPVFLLFHGGIFSAVSYTHLDVYKRQPLR